MTDLCVHLALAIVLFLLALALAPEVHPLVTVLCGGTLIGLFIYNKEK